MLYEHLIQKLSRWKCPQKSLPSILFDRRIRRLLDVLRRLFAGRACDWALLTQIPLHNLAFLCIFVVSWCIFAFFWPAVLIFIPSKCTLISLISGPNEKLPRFMNWRRNRRKKHPARKLSFISVNSSVLYLSLSRYTSPRTPPIWPYFCPQREHEVCLVNSTFAAWFAHIIGFSLV